MSEAILSFQGASYAADADHDGRLEDVHFALHPGQLALVQLSSRAQRVPLADGATGLVKPTSGEVLYAGERWRDRSVSDCVAARHTIGRVYEGTEWVSNLDIDENVLLPACHHTLRPEAELVDEALALAQRFGLEDLPDRRQGTVSRIDLRGYALVRALLGSPRLLIFERPLRQGGEIYAQGLRLCLEEARALGAAVLWTTDSTNVWNDPNWNPDLRLVFRGPRLEPWTDPKVQRE